jgi:dephospho-CoA kinase
MAKLILGIAGEMGSGKDAVAKHLSANYGAHTHNFSQILSDILNRLYLPIVRENQAPLSGMLRKTFGEDILAKVTYHDSIEDTADIIVVQGIRRLEDMTYLRQLPNFKLLYVEVDMETRYERVKKRGEKANDSEMSFEEFKKTHSYETELQIADLKNYATHTIDNNGTYQDLHKKVDEIVKQYI